MVKILGFKPARFRQWLAVVQEEGRQITPSERLALALTLFKAALRLGGVPRSRWRYRLRTCWRCPIYDRSMKRCRPQTAHPLGCGCYTPFLSLVPKPYPLPGCWATQDPRLKHLGWV